MADLTLAEARKARDNLATEDQLIQKMNRLEAETLSWMAEATNLHAAVEPSDQANVIALRDQLVAKLQAAVTI